VKPSQTLSKEKHPFTRGKTKEGMRREDECPTMNI
jgi:hypothetical protein